MDSQYPTAPELPRKVPQLVRDGKRPESTESAPSSVPTEAPEEPIEDPDELNEHVDDPGDPDGIVAAEQEQVQQPSTYKEPVRSTEPKKKKRWPIILIVLLLVVAGVVAYKISIKKASAPSSSNATTTQASTTKKPAKSADVPTKEYDSTIYTLSFSYPETWTVSDTATKLTVTSPATQLKGVGGSNQSVHVFVTIQNQQTIIPGYPPAGAVAAVTSEKLTYKQPTAVQRAQTYLSYLGYKSSGLDALYVTGDNGYQQGQTVPLGDVIKGNPLVSVTFATCSTVDCATGTPTAVTLDVLGWQGSDVAKQVTTLLESLQFN